MARPKYDYDSEDFYRRIRKSAERQMRDSHIIWDKVIAKDLSLNERTFSEMKRGEYRHWSESENETRRRRINEVLSEAEESFTPEVWKMILEMGLGNAESQDTVFDVVDGKAKNSQRVTVHKLPPNLGALQLWLRHHSKTYRGVESGKADNDDDVPTEISHGVDIDKWIEKEVSDDQDA